MKITRKTKKVTAASDAGRAYLYNVAPAIRQAVRNYLKKTGADPRFSCVLENDDVMRLRIDSLNKVDSLADFIYEIVGDSKLSVNVVGDNVIEIRCIEDTVDASTNSYGGAYDLEGEGFFTKDDLVEFDNQVIEILQECYPDTFRVDDSYIENNVIYLSVESSQGDWAEGSVKVDMRKIRKPSDILKYSNTMVGKLREELDTAYIESSTTVEGTMLPGPGDYAPPDNDLEEADEVTECIDVQVDTNIIIGTDNTWDYEDDSYSWAAPDSNSDSWYSDEYPSLVLDDASGIADKVADLVMNNLPEEPGRYHLSANVSLCYSVTGVYVIDNFEGMDEDGHPNVSRELITDNAQVYHERSKDSIEDLECIKIDDAE